MHRTWNTQRWRLACAATWLVALGACTDPASGPAPRLSPDIDDIAVADGGRSDSMFVPNWRKYADSGQHPVVGRAGSASMSMWALLSRDGTADVELVAGGWGGWTRGRQMLDSLPGGVRIARAQLKVIGPDGALRYTRNFTLGRPAASIPAAGLVRGGRAQVQGVVEGADFARAGVVTVDAPALLRPDLTVSAVQSGPRAGVNTTITVAAVVRELNGELGAWADCVLYVDDVESSRAYGVWVDAGGTATCLFSHTFRSAGTKRLEVRVEGSAPGDYDMSNNAASRTITVLNVLSSFWFNAGFEDRSFDNTYSSSGSWTSADGMRGNEQSQTDTSTGRVQQSYLAAWMPHAVQFPLRDVQARQYTAFETVHAVRFLNLPADWSWDDGYMKQSCVNRGYDQPNLGRGWLYVCAYELRAPSDSAPGGAPLGWTTVQYDRYAGDVTYRSRSHSRFWDRAYGIDDSYTWNYSSRDVVGRFARYNLEYLFFVGIFEPTRTSSVNTVIGLLPFSWSQSTPRSCWSGSDPWGSYTNCYESSGTESGVSGVVSGEPNP